MNDAVLFNEAHIKWMQLGKAHELAYMVADCKSTKYYHHSKARDCFDKAAILRELVIKAKDCSQQKHGLIVFRIGHNKGDNIPIERMCHC